MEFLTVRFPSPRRTQLPVGSCLVWMVRGRGTVLPVSAELGSLFHVPLCKLFISGFVKNCTLPSAGHPCCEPPVTLKISVLHSAHLCGEPCSKLHGSCGKLVYSVKPTGLCFIEEIQGGSHVIPLPSPPGKLEAGATRGAGEVALGGPLPAASLITISPQRCSPCPYLRLHLLQKNKGSERPWLGLRPTRLSSTCSQAPAL